MKNLFVIAEEEKNRILGLHESATNNQYLIFEQVSDTDIAGKIYTASYGPGTNDGNFTAAIEQIGSLEQLISVDNLLKKGYGQLGLQGQINDEFNPKGYNDRISLDKIKTKLTSLGADLTYDQLRNNSVVINYAKTSQNTTGQPTGQASTDTNTQTSADVNKNNTTKVTTGNKNKGGNTGPSNAQKVQTKLKELDPNTPQTGKMDQATINKIMNLLTQGVKPATSTTYQVQQSSSNAQSED